ncbi:hypothetical protein EVAR_71173_1 [Eumeta japonica]|uniref:Uncharacterized protein n=1 Tax=Eumeta variegata TaxID=151549 RepID=A0A4C1ZKV8_EUMVA|nr:hypothetical protein EVAR_71173_1 [Eumeta japonica]
MRRRGRLEAGSRPEYLSNKTTPRKGILSGITDRFRPLLINDTECFYALMSFASVTIPGRGNIYSLLELWAGQGRRRRWPASSAWLLKRTLLIENVVSGTTRALAADDAAPNALTAGQARLRLETRGFVEEKVPRANDRTVNVMSYIFSLLTFSKHVFQPKFLEQFTPTLKPEFLKREYTDKWSILQSFDYPFAGYGLAFLKRFRLIASRKEVLQCDFTIALNDQGCQCQYVSGTVRQNRTEQNKKSDCRKMLASAPHIARSARIRPIDYENPERGFRSALRVFARTFARNVGGSENKVQETRELPRAQLKQKKVPEQPLLNP